MNVESADRIGRTVTAHERACREAHATPRGVRLHGLFQ